MAGRFRQVLAAALILCAGGLPALGQGTDTPEITCAGANLIDALPADQRARIDAAAALVPFHKGLVWQAHRGGAQMTIIGTYHFDDPRHDAVLSQVVPYLMQADLLMVEAGPEEEAQLMQAMIADPTLMADPEGPTLAERLTPEDWALLSEALSERGVPAMIGSRFRPWYMTMMMGISPCMMRKLAETGGESGGLDQMLVDLAEHHDIPVRALEPWDTIFSIFADLTPQQEIDMLRSTLPTALYADDYGATLADAYFAGDVWTLWEFSRFDAYENSGLTRDEVDQMMDLAQDRLMDMRNKSWIAPMERAAGEAAEHGKGIVVGFGALHLPGDNGVLHLLEKQGWVVTPLP